MKMKTVTKDQFIGELIDSFIDTKIFGYECVGGTHDQPNKTIILDMTKKKNGKYKDMAIQIDLSNVVIEFGDNNYDDDGNGEFISKRTLE